MSHEKSEIEGISCGFGFPPFQNLRHEFKGFQTERGKNRLFRVAHKL